MNATRRSAADVHSRYLPPNSAGHMIWQMKMGWAMPLADTGTEWTQLNSRPRLFLVSCCPFSCPNPLCFRQWHHSSEQRGSGCSAWSSSWHKLQAQAGDYKQRKWRAALLKSQNSWLKTQTSFQLPQKIESQNKRRVTRDK